MKSVWGQWLERVAELHASDDGLDEDCREARQFVVAFRVPYEMFRGIVEAVAPAFPSATHDVAGRECIPLELKGVPDFGDGNGVVPGFPTEGPREFGTSSSSANSPVTIRKLSSDDKAKLKTNSIENDSVGWIRKSLFKKEVEWPRELYLNVLGCKALLPPGRGSGQKPLTETATASVTTDEGVNGSGGTSTAPSSSPAAAAAPAPRESSVIGADADASVDSDVAAAVALDQSPEQVPEEESDGVELRVRSEESGGSYDSSLDSADGAGGLEEGNGDTGGMECFVLVRNATTGRDLKTQGVRGGANPVFRESLVVPCQGPRDAIVLGVYYKMAGDHPALLGEAALPLDARVIGVSHPVVLSVKDAHGHNRGFLRVETFWMDEAKPRKERGEFYYRVVHRSGVRLRNHPSMSAEKALHVMEYGEVFLASERQWLVGDEESTTFVKVCTSRDRWARSGWCFETLYHRSGTREVVLERVSPPRREFGKFFYRVCHVDGAKLHSRPDLKSKLIDHLLPEGRVLEASEKCKPAGSSVTFVAVENKRGYIIHRCDEKGVANTAGEPVLEQVECPEGVVVSSAGLPDADLPQLTRPPGVACISPGASTLTAKNPRAAGLISAAESKAAAQAVRRLYRVRGGVDGVGGVRTPDIDAPVADVMEEGSAFFSKAEVVKRYDGIGDVAFVMRELDGLWVRANRPGGKVLLDCFTNRVEVGAFTYRVSHENGVLVRTAPGLEAPPVKPKRILPVSKLINVCERLTRAEDIMALSRPPTFLRLAGNDGWVFDRRGHTLVCEDVTIKSRIATVNAIAAEAAQLTLST